MADRHWFDGEWTRDPAFLGFAYFTEGWYDDGSMSVEPVKRLTDKEARQLIPVLESAGFITPRLDERLRTEDLKITHRLLDIIDKQVQP